MAALLFDPFFPSVVSLSSDMDKFGGTGCHNRPDYKYNKGTPLFWT